MTYNLSQKDIKRFWSKVDKSDKCWNWRPPQPNFSVSFDGHKRTIRITRVSWFLVYGLLLENNLIRQICKNNKCVNPNHLILIRAVDGKKTCSLCGFTKNINNFNKKNDMDDGLSTICKDCRKIYDNMPENRKVVKQRIDKNKITIIEIKESNPCIDCHEYFPACVMEFDHISGVKRRNLSKMKHYGIESIMEEIAKCELVCVNCHRIRTYNRMLDKNKEMKC